MNSDQGLLIPMFQIYCNTSNNFKYKLSGFIVSDNQEKTRTTQISVRKFRNINVNLLHAVCPYSRSPSKQGSHMLEKYLNLKGFFKKSLKIKSALKSTGKSLKGLEKSLNSSIFSRIYHC